MQYICCIFSHSSALASTSSYFSRELKRNSKLEYSFRTLFFFVFFSSFFHSFLSFFYFLPFPFSIFSCSFILGTIYHSFFVCSFLPSLLSCTFFPFFRRIFLSFYFLSFFLLYRSSIDPSLIYYFLYSLFSSFFLSSPSASFPHSFVQSFVD